MGAVQIDTPHGPARAQLHPAQNARAALVLGHGAGGGVQAPDLVAATEVALEHGVSVALVEQPYRVAGRRSAAPAHQLDSAWTAVIDHLSSAELAGLSLITGGRSSGARVACRTAAATRAVAVLCLAFPLLPPQRKGGTPRESRLAELEAVDVPMLIVQGEGDQFGMPEPAPGREVARVKGNHSLRSGVGAVRAAIAAWLPGVGPMAVAGGAEEPASSPTARWTTRSAALR